jgi:hypothetical protein
MMVDSKGVNSSRPRAILDHKSKRRRNLQCFFRSVRIGGDGRSNGRAENFWKYFYADAAIGLMLREAASWRVGALTIFEKSRTLYIATSSALSDALDCWKPKLRPCRGLVPSRRAPFLP